jgi:hypothetical protein
MLATLDILFKRQVYGIDECTIPQKAREKELSSKEMQRTNSGHLGAIESGSPSLVATVLE